MLNQYPIGKLRAASVIQTFILRYFDYVFVHLLMERVHLIVGHEGRVLQRIEP